MQLKVLLLLLSFVLVQCRMFWRWDMGKKTSTCKYFNEVSKEAIFDKHYTISKCNGALLQSDSVFPPAGKFYSKIVYSGDFNILDHLTEYEDPINRKRNISTVLKARLTRTAGLDEGLKHCADSSAVLHVHLYQLERPKNKLRIISYKWMRDIPLSFRLQFLDADLVKEKTTCGYQILMSDFRGVCCVSRSKVTHVHIQVPLAEELKVSMSELDRIVQVGIEITFSITGSKKPTEELWRYNRTAQWSWREYIGEVQAPKTELKLSDLGLAGFFEFRCFPKNQRKPSQSLLVNYLIVDPDEEEPTKVTSVTTRATKECMHVEEREHSNVSGIITLNSVKSVHSENVALQYHKKKKYPRNKIAALAPRLV